MWSMLKVLLVQGFLARTALRSFAWLAWILPLGFLLKWVGLPIIAVLGTLALPVLILLAIVGLPIIVIVVFGGMLLTIAGFVLTMGLAVLKVLLPVALVFLVVRWLWRRANPAVTPAGAAPSAR
jgi:hypothetical protein